MIKDKYEASDCVMHWIPRSKNPMNDVTKGSRYDSHRPTNGVFAGKRRVGRKGLSNEAFWVCSSAAGRNESKLPPIVNGARSAKSEKLPTPH